MKTLPIVLALTAVTAFAQPRPKLGVIVVIDQLDSATFNRRVPLTKGGFKRLTSEGFRFHEMRYEVAPTLTSAGHATIATGAYASVHGIVSNEWVDPTTGKSVLSTEDARYQAVGRAPARDGTAPTFLMVPTLGDAMKAQEPKAKVVTVSGKDRSAILLAGRAADAAVWFDADRPMFITSNFYAKELPAFVAPTNAKVLEALAKKAFTWSESGTGRQGDSEPDAEQPALQPLVDGWEVDLALAAVKQFSLGADDVPDLLCVSFSGHDRIGHNFGAESPESLAEFLAVDVELGRLLSGLDAAVGKGSYVVGLTADHGVAPVPEPLVERRIDAGRLDLKALREKLEQRADELLGVGDWFVGNKTPGITASAAGRAKLVGIGQALRDVALKQPGVLDLLWAERFGETTQAAELWRKGTFLGRSPDFLVVAKPYWIYSRSDPTGHASHWLYDRSVPMVFFGAGVPKGKAPLAEAADFAPTLAMLLGVPPPPAAQGRPLSFSSPR